MWLGKKLAKTKNFQLCPSFWKVTFKIYISIEKQIENDASIDMDIWEQYVTVMYGQDLILAMNCEVRDFEFHVLKVALY